MTDPSEVRGRSLGGTPGAARHSKGHRGVLLLPGGMSSSWRSHGFVANAGGDLRHLVTRSAMETHGSCVGICIVILVQPFGTDLIGRRSASVEREK